MSVPSKKNISGPWLEASLKLEGAFWSSKGLSGVCPFCRAQSEPGKERFLVRFDEGGQFQGYGCFVCQAWGKGPRSQGKLLSLLGVRVGLLKLHPLDSRGLMDDASPEGAEGGLSLGRSSRADGSGGPPLSAEPIDWPPRWQLDSDRIFEEGFSYMERRGIVRPEEKIDRHALIFSEAIAMDEAGAERGELFDYPCLIAPMETSDGEKVGFTSRRLRDDGRPSSEPKSIAMRGQGWKERALFGFSALDPRRPVAIVEGLFSALSTPNAIALGGKSIHGGQLEALASLKAAVYVLALDPGVDPASFARAAYMLRQKSRGSLILAVDWPAYGEPMGRDPNDRGEEEMREIIKKTVLDGLKK